MKKTSLIVALVFLTLILSSCGSAGFGGATGGIGAIFRELFTGVSAGDAQWDGIKSGEAYGLTATLVGALDPDAARLAAILESMGQQDPLGVILPLKVVGETEARHVICLKQFRDKCRQIPLNAKVHFAGVYSGSFWHPSALSAENFND